MKDNNKILLQLEVGKDVLVSFALHIPVRPGNILFTSLLDALRYDRVRLGYGSKATTRSASVLPY